MNNRHLYAAFGAAFSAAFVVVGCNRLHGVGHDIEKSGLAIDKAAK